MSDAIQQRKSVQLLVQYVWVQQSSDSLNAPSPRESFTLISNDYDPDTSAVGIARKVCTVGSEISVGLLGRHAIVYIKAGSNPLIISANSY